MQLTKKKYKFTGYYKYEFTFKADDGTVIVAGGDAGDIYRSDVNAEMTLAEIQREFGDDYKIFKE